MPKPGLTDYNQRERGRGSFFPGSLETIFLHQQHCLRALIIRLLLLQVVHDCLHQRAAATFVRPCKVNA